MAEDLGVIVTWSWRCLFRPFCWMRGHRPRYVLSPRIVTCFCTYKAKAAPWLKT